MPAIFDFRRLLRNIEYMIKLHEVKNLAYLPT